MLDDYVILFLLAVNIAAVLHAMYTAQVWRREAPVVISRT